MAVMTKISRELFEDSLNLESELPRILTVAMAKEMDRIALLGSAQHQSHVASQINQALAQQPKMQQLHPT